MSLKEKKKSTGPAYEGISFAEGYNKSFEDFKAEFEDTHVFKNKQPGEREKALQEAWKIATNGNLKATATQGASAK